MYVLIKFLLLTVFSLTYTFVSCQDFKPHSYVVQSTSESDLHKIIALGSDNRSISPNYLKSIFPAANIYEVFIPNNETLILEGLKQSTSIRSISINAGVKNRNIPNDPLYSQLDNLKLIKAEEVWNTSTGGITREGNEIVVAILDDGYELLHEDLQTNIWSNKEEIDNDGIDNDNNGYVDDYYGLNVDTGDDNHPVFTHGTAVAGIIGAEGDNNKGISGINWNIKMMCISQADFLSEIVEGYNYVYEQRKRYNESNGSAGAFVVATNFSAGINGGQPTDFMAWCDIYDALGMVGVMNVVATTNANVNVDEEGDMPSTCPSEYMIAVTNTTQSDIFDNSGSGKIHIDLSAPGTGTWTTDRNNDYDTFGGTSGSTPHVTGAIALLYSIACEELLDEVKNNPSQAALLLKNAVLAGGDELAELEDITATGKRLNILGASQQLGSICGTIIEGPLQVLSINGYRSTDNTIEVDYITNTSNEHEVIIVDMLGRLIYHSTFVPQLFGERTIRIPSNQLVAGTYFVSIIDNDKKASKTLSIIY